MPSIARTLPLGWSDRCRVEMMTGGEVLPLITGGARRYTELDEPLRRYTLRPTLMLDTSTELEEWVALVGQVHRDDGILWIPEPASVAHRGLRCGPITNGTRTTYPIPAINPTDVTVFIDGVPVDPSTYTLHSVANLITDDGCADVSLLSYFVTAHATSSIVDGISGSGRTSAMIEGNDGSDPVFRSGWFDILPSRAHTMIANILESTAGTNHKAGIWWGDAGYSYLSSSYSAGDAVGAGVWTPISHTTTSPANAYSATVASRGNASAGTAPWYTDCFALCPGDYDTWHLPSVAPGLVEFDTAPAAGSRITASATGRRLTRCTLSPVSQWSASSRHPTVQTIEAIETPEV